MALIMVPATLDDAQVTVLLTTADGRDAMDSKDTVVTVLVTDSANSADWKLFQAEQPPTTAVLLKYKSWNTIWFAGSMTSLAEASANFILQNAKVKFDGTLKCIADEVDDGNCVGDDLGTAVRVNDGGWVGTGEGASVGSLLDTGATDGDAVGNIIGTE